jgi:MoaA/NifB/PqqE/SkfB family radical SAM enzyme
MDDGGIKKYTSKKSGKVTSCQFFLATYVSKKEAIIIQDYFKEVWDINFLIRQEKNGKWRHYCNTGETRKLSDLIRPYVIPSLSYKIL